MKTLNYPELESVYVTIANNEDNMFDPVEMEQNGENEMDYVFQAWLDTYQDEIMVSLLPDYELEDMSIYTEKFDEYMEQNQDEIWDNLYSDLDYVKEYFSVRQLRKRKIQKIMS